MTADITERCLCGGPMLIKVRLQAAQGAPERHHYCECLKCGLRGPEVHPMDGDEKEAINAWYGCMNAVLTNVKKCI